MPKMLKLITPVMVGVLCGAADADIVEFTMTAQMVTADGANVEGLDGATLTYTTRFDLSNPYGSVTGLFPSLDAVAGSATVVISGATVAANNDTYDLPDMAFTPFFGSNRASFDDNINGFPINFNINAGTSIAPPLVQLWLGFDAAPGTSSIAIGDQPKLADFAVGDYSTFGLQPSPFAPPTGATFYDFLDVQTNVRVVPAPGGALLLTACGLLSTKRRRGSTG